MTGTSGFDRRWEGSPHPKGTNFRCVYFEYTLLNCFTTERSNDLACAFRAVRRPYAVG